MQVQEEVRIVLFLHLLCEGLLIEGRKTQVQIREYSRSHTAPASNWHGLFNKEYRQGSENATVSTGQSTRHADHLGDELLLGGDAYSSLQLKHLKNYDKTKITTLIQSVWRNISFPCK